MFPDEFGYVRADSLAHAADLLDEHPNARPLAGGQSLVPLLKFRLAVPDVVVDIGHLSPAEPITFEGDRVRLHALTTHADAGGHERLTDTFDVVADAIPQLADPQVRNQGTVGGALAQADPSGDWGPLALVLSATVHTLSPDGGRDVPVEEFYQGGFRTVLREDELIESVSCPIPESADRAGGAYLKVKRRQGVYGVACVGVHLALNDDGRCVSFEAAASAVGREYFHPEDVADPLVGERIEPERIADAAEEFGARVNPAADNHGSEEYKRALCRALFERAVETARQRALGTDVPADPSGLAEAA